MVCEFETWNSGDATKLIRTVSECFTVWGDIAGSAIGFIVIEYIVDDFLIYYQFDTLIAFPYAKG